MRSGPVASGVAVCLAAVAGAAIPAAAGTAITPRAGAFSGQETAGANPLPVTFTVAKGRKRVVHFVGQAETRAGCTNHITGFQAPTGPMKINKGAHFTASSSNYPQKGVTVTVTGRFTSPTTARGHISVRIVHVKGCAISRLFTASR